MLLLSIHYNRWAFSIINNSYNSYLALTSQSEPETGCDTLNSALYPKGVFEFVASQIDDRLAEFDALVKNEVV